jgi:hypothetical protein
VELSAGSPANRPSEAAELHISSGLQRFEPVEDRAVLAPRRACSAGDGLDPRNGFALHLEIDFRVPAGGCWACVPEQVADGGQVYTGFQKRYGGAVAHAVRMESFLPQVRRIVTGTRQAVSKDVPDSEAGHRRTSMIDEHMHFWV